MEQSKNTRKILLEHVRHYPKLQIQDIFKFLYQSSFGCEHLVRSEEDAVLQIKRELCDAGEISGELVEELDGNYCRVSLGYVGAGLSVTTLGKLFCMSAKREESPIPSLEKKLKTTEQLISQGELPFSLKEFSNSLGLWKSAGYPSLHHSEQFRALYRPAYRVISSRYLPFLPLLARLDSLKSETSAILAIEGPCASGKTTLSQLLESLYDCSVFHMDDFFLRPQQRTPERLAEIGGNVDRERFLEEVLIPLSKNKPVTFRRFDCSTLTLSRPVTTAKKPLTVIEGSYSMHPDLSKYYTLSVFLDIPPENQKKRIQKRNFPQSAAQFFSRWIPLEQRYFENTDAKNRCDIVIPILK